MTGTLTGIAILFPFAAALLCLAIKNHLARAGVILLSGVVLITTSILLFIGGELPFEASLAQGWDIAILVLDYVLMAYFLFLGVRDLRQNGAQLRNIATIGLVLAQVILLGLFEFVWAAEMPLVADPSIYIDHLSLIMCLVISIIGSLICIYGIKYMKDHEEHQGLKKTKQNRFFFYMLILLGAMNGIVFANNILWLYFFWEITTLCCYALIRYEGTAQAIANGFRALWMNLIGGLGFVLAVILIYNNFETLSLIELISNPDSLMLLPLALLFVAALTKSAQVPFQGWLLGAMVAPVPVSALLHSSTMVKAGVYLAVRTAPAFTDTYLSSMIAVFGAFTFVTTAIMAIGQSEAKRVLAYSTISNLGLIMLCVGINTPLAITAAIILIVFHAISKGMLFLSVGVIEHSIWSKNIEDMEGLSRKLPLITGITIAGMVSMLLVPFGALVGKWAAIEASGASADALMPIIMICLVIGSAATTVFWVKWIGRLLTQSPGGSTVKREPFKPLYHAPVMLLAGGAVVFSVLITVVYNGLIKPAVSAFYPVTISTDGWLIDSGIGVFAAWPLFALLAVLLLAIPFLTKTKPEQVRAAYMCGENMAYDVPSFRSVSSGETELKLGSLYMGEYLSNPKVENWFKGIALGILAILFLVVLV